MTSASTLYLISTLIWSGKAQTGCDPVHPDTTAEAQIIAEVSHLNSSVSRVFVQIEFLPLLSVFIFLHSQRLAVLILFKFTLDSQLAAASNPQWSKTTWAFGIGVCHSLATELTWLYLGKYFYKAARVCIMNSKSFPFSMQSEAPDSNP